MGGSEILGVSTMRWEAEKRSGSFENALGGLETLWELQKRSRRRRNALGVSKRPWEAQKRFGSLKNALGGSEALWELQKGSGRLRNALGASKSFGKLRNVDPTPLTRLSLLVS